MSSGLDDDLKDYMSNQLEDIRKFREELSKEEGREVTEEEAVRLWIERGRADEYHDCVLREQQMKRRSLV